MAFGRKMKEPNDVRESDKEKFRNKIFPYF